MNKFKYYFFLSITTLSLFSCSNNDTAEVTPKRLCSTIRHDITDIEEYLKTIIIVVDHAGFADDQDVY
jgi:hypothetical protein